MYKNKKVIHIVCMDELGGIGKLVNTVVQG